MAKLIEPEPLGYAMVVVAFTTSIVGFIGTGMSVTVSKFISEYNAKGKYNLSNIVFIKGSKYSIIVSCIAAGILALLSTNIANSLYNNPILTPLLIVSALTFVPSQTISFVQKGAFEGNQTMQYTFYIDLIYQTIRLSATLALLYFGFAEFGIILAFGIASIIITILGHIYIKKHVLHKDPNSTADKLPTRSFIKFSGMNYVDIGMRTLSMQIGVIILGTQSFEWASFYGLALLIGNVIGGILRSLARALLPAASEEYTKNKKGIYAKLLNISFRLSFSLVGFLLIIVILEPSIILNLIGQSYIQASIALQILVVAIVINTATFLINSMLNAASRATNVASIGFISSAISIVLTPILVTLIGLEGAALALFIGSIVSLIGSIILLSRNEQVMLSPMSIIKPTASIITALGLGFFMSSFLNLNSYVSVITMLALYVVTLFIYKAVNTSELLSILSSIRGKHDT